MPESDPTWVIPEPAQEPPEKMPRVLKPGYQVFRWAIATPKRRNFWVKATRAMFVIGLVGLVTAVLLPELTNTAQPAPDPLTCGCVVKLGPDNSSGFSGLVDGDDVVAGNFTVVSPHGTPVLFDVLLPGNGTWGDRLSGSVYTVPGPTDASNFAFTASYTDWYIFVWTNPYDYNVTIYVSSNYLSSAPPA